MFKLIDGGKKTENALLPARALHFERSRQLARHEVRASVLRNTDIESWKQAIKLVWEELRRINRLSILKVNTIDAWLGEHPLPDLPENRLIASGEVLMPFGENEVRQCEAVMRYEWFGLLSDVWYALNWGTSRPLEMACQMWERRGKELSQLSFLDPKRLQDYCREAVREQLMCAIGGVMGRYKRGGWENVKIEDREGCIAAYHCGPLLNNADAAGINIGGLQINLGPALEGDDFATFNRIIEGSFNLYGKYEAPIVIQYKRAIERGLLPPPLHAYEKRIRELQAIVDAGPKPIIKK